MTIMVATRAFVFIVFHYSCFYYHVITIYIGYTEAAEKPYSWGQRIRVLGWDLLWCVVEKFRVKSVGMRGLIYRSPNRY